MPSQFRAASQFMGDDNSSEARGGGDRPPGGKTGSKPAPDAFSSQPLPDKIGAMLRKNYEEVVSEGIPDDFLDLLKAADSKSA